VRQLEELGLTESLEVEYRLSPRGSAAWRTLLLGDRFTALDPYALMLGRWTRSFERPARSLPLLGPHLRRLLARPAVQRVLQREGLADPLL